VFFDELDAAAGADARYDAYVAALKAQFTDLDDLEYRSRVVVGRLALALQGSLLVRSGNPAVADAFLASRLAGDWGTVYGTLPTGLDLAPIIERVVPTPA
jgi:putative acyl-CoA dehydrogenase